MMIARTHVLAACRRCFGSAQMRLRALLPEAIHEPSTTRRSTQPSHVFAKLSLAGMLQELLTICREGQVVSTYATPTAQKRAYKFNSSQILGSHAKKSKVTKRLFQLICSITSEAQKRFKRRSEGSERSEEAQKGQKNLRRGSDSQKMRRKAGPEEQAQKTPSPQNVEKARPGR